MAATIHGLQQNIHSSQMADQVQPARPISMLQNVASRRKMIDGHHMHMSSQISNLGTGKSGAPVGYNSFGTGQSRAPIGFTSFRTGQSGPSFPGFLGRQPGPSEVPLHGLVPFDASTQLTPTSQPNPLPGQHEARGFAAFSGRGGSAFRGLPTDCQAIDKLPVTGQGTFTQLVIDDLKQENKGLQTSYSSTDDELSVFTEAVWQKFSPYTIRRVCITHEADSRPTWKLDDWSIDQMAEHRVVDFALIIA